MKEKNIKRLKQLDRIEYRIRRIDNMIDYIFLSQIGLLLSIFTIVGSLWIYFLALTVGELEKYLIPLSIYSIVVVSISLFFVLLSIILFIYGSKKLNKEYTKLTVKKRGKK